MKILLVEDDAPLRQALQELLCREGYQVVSAQNAAQARLKMDGSIRLAMLDVTLPDGDGVSLCAQWRREGLQTPILFLTARDEELDVVRGLDAGGNDYVAKPFRMQELLSRIRVLLRGSGASDRGVLRSGIHLDQERLQASRDGKGLNLTLMEFRLLSMLLGQSRIVTRGMLLEALWDVDSRFVDDNTLSVHISRLREKVGPRHIKTVRGVGYQWVD